MRCISGCVAPAKSCRREPRPTALSGPEISATITGGIVVNGSDAYEAAIEHTLDVARFAEAEVLRRPNLELVRERDLSVVVFRRLGWEPADYAAWSDRMLADEFAFVVPTSHDGETLGRFAIVNPETSEDDITAILDTMD